MKIEVYQDLEPAYKTNMNYLEDWVFHYNIHADKWAAIPRDHYHDYWNDFSHPSIIRSSKIETLLELLHKTKGDVSNLEEKLNVKSK